MWFGAQEIIIIINNNNNVKNSYAAEYFCGKHDTFLGSFD